MSLERKTIQTNSLDALFEKLREEGRQILAPRQKGDRIFFDRISSMEEMATDYIQTTVSAKSVVFPPWEEVLHYRFKDKETFMEDTDFEPPPTVVFGLRPCDAKSFIALNAVFTWDITDTFFARRLENTVIIAVSCAVADNDCFCTSVGGGPGDTAGSDILLTAVGKEKYLAEIVTDKGRKIVDMAGDLFQPVSGDIIKEDFLADVPEKFNIDELSRKLPESFDKGLWLEESLRCLGCGTCAFLCPVCVCFDLQDEINGQEGARLRCWDSCGFSLFTLHASCHNPRSVQSERWRQRVMHKFSYMPDRLDVFGCVGCGRCSRSCPVDMNLLEKLQAIVEA